MTDWDDVAFPPSRLRTIETMQRELERWAKAHPEEYEAALLIGERFRRSQREALKAALGGQG